jgi:hypothetical protein
MRRWWWGGEVWWGGCCGGGGRGEGGVVGNQEQVTTFTFMLFSMCMAWVWERPIFITESIVTKTAANIPCTQINIKLW